MIKLFLTGDNHFGRRYERYPDVKNILTESRKKSFAGAIEYANDFDADFFIIAGDLFDRISGITREETVEIVELLTHFEGTVLVLPGNHDYFTGEEQLWRYFEDECAGIGADILLLKEYKPYEFEVKGEKIVFYPAFCRSKHGEKNNLDWIKKLKIEEEGIYNIGIAHGAIEGITPDRQKEYFLMTEDELEKIPMDAWLIGHTHVIYPFSLSEKDFSEAGRIFNAGTHEQTDLGTNTDGCCIALEVEKNDGISVVRAKKIHTGRIRFKDIKLEIKTLGEDALERAFKQIEPEFTEMCVIRVTITGAINTEEYNNRYNLYDKYLKNCLSYEIVDAGLNELITKEMIADEFAETSFAAKLLTGLMDEPKEAQLVYDLIKSGVF